MNQAQEPLTTITLDEAILVWEARCKVAPWSRETAHEHPEWRYEDPAQIAVQMLKRMRDGQIIHPHTAERDRLQGIVDHPIIKACIVMNGLPS